MAQDAAPHARAPRTQKIAMGRTGAWSHTNFTVIGTVRVSLPPDPVEDITVSSLLHWLP